MTDIPELNYMPIDTKLPWWKRLLCQHDYKPIPHWFYGSHTCWDAVFTPKRVWQCNKCGKEIVRKELITQTQL